MSTTATEQRQLEEITSDNLLQRLQGELELLQSFVPEDQLTRIRILHRSDFHFLRSVLVLVSDLRDELQNDEAVRKVLREDPESFFALCSGAGTVPQEHLLDRVST